MKNFTLAIMTFSLSVICYAQPTSNFTFSAPAIFGRYCASSVFAFTSTASGGVVSWDWNFGDGTTSTLTNPTHTYTSQGPKTITLIVTDAGGLTDSHSQTVSIIAPQADFSFTPTATGCSVPQTVFFTDQSAFPDTWSWNFGDGTTSTNVNPAHTFTSPGSYNVSLTVSDTNFGCTDTYTETIDISVLSANINGSGVFGCGPLTNNFTQSSTNAGAGTIDSYLWDFGDGNTSTAENPTHTYDNSGTYSVSLTVTNSVGCSSTDTKTNFVQVVGPDPNFGADTLTADCGPLTVNFSDSTIFSAPITSWAWSFGDGGTSNLQNPTHTYTTTGNFDVSLTITDIDGCSRTETFDDYINIIDNVAPAIVCPTNIQVNNDPGTCGAIATYTAPVGTDNCTNPTTSLIAGFASGTVFPLGATTNTYQVIDVGGQTAFCFFTVTVIDAESPMITCPANISQDNDPGVCGAIVTYTAPVGTDNCAGPITTQTAGLASGSLFPVGTTTNTFVVTDTAGLTTSCSFNVVITDSENPIITCPANITQNNDAGSCGAIVNFPSPTFTDNCAGASINQTAGLASGSVFPVGTTTNTFVVTDAAGLTDTCSFDVVITDTEAPQITCPVNINQNNDIGVCGAIVNYTAPVVTDNCTGSNTVQTAGLASGSVFPIGTTTNTFLVTDAAGLTANCSFDVVITDNENPTIACPTNITQSTDPGNCSAVVTFTAPIGTDNCAGATTVQTAGLPSGSSFPVGTSTITYTVTDAVGLTSTCSFNIIISDSENPTITCPGDINQNTDLDACGAIVTFTAPTGSDNCTGASTSQTTGLPSGSFFPIGTTTNTFVVTDLAGNTSTCSFNVVISDNQAPSFGTNCPATISADNDPGVCGGTITFPDPIATDNCPGVTIVQTAGLASGSLFPVGTTTITFVATDAGGLTATCSFDVVISDTALPNITCPENISTCDSIITIAEPTISDNCDNPTFALLSGIDSGNLFPEGNTINTYQATDLSGNTATCEVTISRLIQPKVTIDESIEIDAGKTVILAPTSTNATFFYWLPESFLNDPSIEKPIAFPQETTTYTITVESVDGCDAEAEITVVVTETIEVNNLFSPNGDGKNDTWEIKGNYLLDDCTIQIYDSWGNPIFESVGYDNNWDGSNSGKALVEGVYYYVISCPSKESLTGSITVVK